MSSTPVIASSSGVATVSAMTLGLAPGYTVRTTTEGGTTSGYSPIGSSGIEIRPAAKITIDSTAAKIGRSMKNREKSMGVSLRRWPRSPRMRGLDGKSGPADSPLREGTGRPPAGRARGKARQLQVERLALLAPSLQGEGFEGAGSRYFTLATTSAASSGASIATSVGATG